MSRNQQWVPLVHYQGHEISPSGEIRKASNGMILKTSVNQSGVRYVSIRNTTLGKYENKTVGVLVAETFCERYQRDAETVMHLDGNTENNEASNLMWATRWHAMAYHQEIVKNATNLKQRIQDATTGRIYRNIREAAMSTGCLPSQIDYGVRYNTALSEGSSLNFAHTTYPGGHIFKLA